MKRTVHLFCSVRVQVEVSESETRTEAIAKAMDSVDLSKVFDRESPLPGIDRTEFTEEVHFAMVDDLATNGQVAESAWFRAKDGKPVVVSAGDTEFFSMGSL